MLIMSLNCYQTNILLKVKGFKYFICYDDPDDETSLLVRLPKLNRYIKSLPNKKLILLQVNSR